MRSAWQCVFECRDEFLHFILLCCKDLRMHRNVTYWRSQRNIRNLSGSGPSSLRAARLIASWKM